MDVTKRIGPARGRLVNKVALVTGAGSQDDGESVGTGRAIAMVLAREGARVGLIDLHAERAERTRELIAAEGGDSFILTGDITIDAECARFVAQTVARYGELHILVNNAATMGCQGPLDSFADDEWDRVIAVNLKSAMLMSRHAVSAMIAAGGGSILNIASITGLRAHGGAAYGPSKAGLIALTRELAILYGRQGVRSNAIAPGAIHTPMVSALVTPELRAARRRVAPLNVEGDGWDVALAALFLVSDDARFVTGVCLPVDGGYLEVAPPDAHRFISERD